MSGCGCKVRQGYYEYPKGGIEAVWMPDTIEYCPLHAAAPELLRTLKVLVDAINNPDRMCGVIVNEADAVIAQAEGRKP